MALKKIIDLFEKTDLLFEAKLEGVNWIYDGLDKDLAVFSVADYNFSTYSPVGRE